MRAEYIYIYISVRCLHVCLLQFNDKIAKGEFAITNIPSIFIRDQEINNIISFMPLANTV